MSIQQHITVLGTVFTALGVLGVMAGFLVLIMVVGGGLLSGDAHAAAITTGVGFIITFVILLASAPGIIGGLGLLKRKSWSRVLVMILACLNLLSIPIGTAVGVYALWVLTRPEAPQILSR